MKTAVYFLYLFSTLRSKFLRYKPRERQGDVPYGDVASPITPLGISKVLNKYYFFTKGALIIATLIIVALILGCVGKQADALTPAAEAGTPPMANTKVIEVIASQYLFEPAEIVANRGDQLKLILKSVDVPHGIAIKDYDITLFADAGEESAVEFVADKSGTFPFYCNVFCGGGHKEMQGKLIVK